MVNNRESIMPLASQRVGVHCCLDTNGTVMVYVKHKPYPVTQAPSSFVTLALICGVWKVVGEGTGP